MPAPPLQIRTLQEADAALEAFYPANVKRQEVYMLQYIEQLFEYLGNPQERLRVIHVAGTSGKTSTCYYVAALLHAAGKKVGHTVSPHLHAVNERVQLGMVPLLEKQFCSELAVFLVLVEESGIKVTYFELMTAFAYWAFARAGVEYAVIEVGLGGTLDATNVVRRSDKVAVITDIGLDHQHVLGDTVESITIHKAGIIQLKNAVFCYRQDNAVMGQITKRCARMQADLHTFSMSRLPEHLHALPPYQQRNLYLAWQVVRFLARRDHFTLLATHRDTAAQTPIPGRMETVSYKGKEIILDAAHNAQKLQALAASLHAAYPYRPVAVLAAFITTGPDRLPLATSELVKFAEHIIVTQPKPHHTSRGFEEPRLVAALCKTHGQWGIEEEADVQAALNALVQRHEPVLVVTGSLHLLSAIHHILKKMDK